MLAFIGFIALLIFGKFLWDTYVTGKTEKDWQSYKKNEPEKAARITNSDTFDMSTDYKANPVHQQTSLNMIAAFLECEVSEAEETYKDTIREALAHESGSLERFKQAMKELKQHKYKQSVSMKFDPDNTPAAFMERWMQEVLDEFIQSNSIKDADLIKPNESISKISNEEGIEILKKSLLQTDEKLHHYIQNEIGENYLKLHNYREAYDYFKAAWYNVILFESNNKVLVDKIVENKNNTLTKALIESTESFNVKPNSITEESEDTNNKSKTATVRASLKGSLAGLSFKKTERSISSNPTKEEPKLPASEDDESVV